MFSDFPLLPTRVERVNLVCTDNFIDVVIAFPGNDLQIVEFSTDPTNSYIKCYNEHIRTHFEKCRDPDVFRWVPVFFSGLFSVPECEYSIVSINTSRLSSTNGKVLKADKWKEFFDRIKWHFGKLEHKLKFRAFEVSSHPDLEAREVHAFWPFLTPGKLVNFVHMGRENLNSSGKISKLSHTQQWKQTDFINTSFFNNVKIRDFCKLRKSVIRLENFSLKLFRELIEKIENSPRFKTCRITCTKRTRRGASWASRTKNSIHCNLRNRGSPVPGRLDTFRFTGRNNVCFEAMVSKTVGTLFVNIKRIS